jgi:hypothetical protein
VRRRCSRRWRSDCAACAMTRGGPSSNAWPANRAHRTAMYAMPDGDGLEREVRACDGRCDLLVGNHEHRWGAGHRGEHLEIGLLLILYMRACKSIDSLTLPSHSHPSHHSHYLHRIPDSRLDSSPSLQPRCISSPVLRSDLPIDLDPRSANRQLSHRRHGTTHRTGRA